MQSPVYVRVCTNHFARICKWRIAADRVKIRDIMLNTLISTEKERDMRSEIYDILDIQYFVIQYLWLFNAHKIFNYNIIFKLFYFLYYIFRIIINVARACIIIWITNLKIVPAFA